MFIPSVFLRIFVNVMRFRILLFLLPVCLFSCGRETLPVERIAELSAKQCAIMEPSLTDATMPRNFKDGALVTSDLHWWCSGFFPGVCWYTYRISGDPRMKEMAIRQSNKLLVVDSLDRQHDLGFQVMPSSWFAYQETGDSLYLKTVYEAAEKLAKRFNPVVGCIKSWDSSKYTYPVIIDNMMNLDLLTRAASLFDKPEWKEIAITHARTTMKNHFRPDYSSYHLVDYNPEDGSVIRRQTVQGYADESAWSRGQSWGLYGFTMMARETGEEEFLAQAEHIARFLLPLLADRPVPAWDFNAPEESIGQDDASAGAVMASAFLELSKLTADAELSAACKKQAVATLKALCGPEYLAAEGELGGFLLKHSTGNFPKGGEVDVPLTYADYYFMEALWRYRNI